MLENVGKLVAHRKKDYTIELMSVPDSTIISQSFELIELSYDEYLELYAASSQWYKNSAKPNIEWTTCKPHTKIYQTFIKMATCKTSDVPKHSYGKKYITDVPGTSRLVRSFDKSRIYIAYRKGQKTLNQTRINSVCIDNFQREEFFDDVKSKHGYLPFIGKYELVAGDSAFNKWSALMDKMYMREVRRYEQKNPSTN